MNGPDHYRKAEELLVSAVETHEGGPADTNLARAQVHATLALAAATALTGAASAGNFDEQPDLDAWIKAAGVKPS